MKGYKKFQEVVAIIPINKLIKESIELAERAWNVYGLKTPKFGTWYNFAWAFGNVWREYYHKLHPYGNEDIESHIPLSKVLTKRQLNLIRIKRNIRRRYFDIMC
jgi:hypothetical protein